MTFPAPALRLLPDPRPASEVARCLADCDGLQCDHAEGHEGERPWHVAQRAGAIRVWRGDVVWRGGAA